MNCKICNHLSIPIFTAKVLNKYDVEYHRCNSCGFIQTDEPFWLEEAYASAITSLDIGLLSRNIILLPITSALIKCYFDPSGKFIDYGGGYGILTRLMRDKGFDFCRQDIYCENLFAKNFDITDLKMDGKFELLTAFEVFEHLTDPNEELKKMLALSDSIFFSTELVPAGVTKKEDWWYFIPETGQHIALHTVSSLKHLAKQHDLNFYTNGKNLHLLTKRNLKTKTFKLLMNYRIARIVSTLRRSKTLLNQDYESILQQIHQD